MAKPGYIKIVAGKKQLDLLSYEDLYLSLVLRIGTQRRNEQTNARAYCCCRDHNPVELYFDEDGNMIFTGNNQHTEECLSKMNELKNVLEKSALKTEQDRNLPMPVCFSWSVGARANFPVIRPESVPYGQSLTLPQWILYNNSRQFSCRQAINKDKLDNPAQQTSDFYFRISSKRLCNPKTLKAAQATVLFNDKMIFDSAPVGKQDFFYGKIRSVYGIDDDERKKVIIRSTDKKNRSVSFFMPKKLFLEAYDSVPLQENVWIAGFIKKKEVLAELPTKGMGLGDINPMSSHVAAKLERPKKVILEMTVGCLFCCNRYGLIIFSKKEFEESNRLMDLGYGIYRPVLSKDTTLYRFNEDGPDTAVV